MLGERKRVLVVQERERLMTQFGKILKCGSILVIYVSQVLFQVIISKIK